MSPFAHVTGWGMAVPEGILTNNDLAQRVETSDEWIRERTGIAERRIASEQQSTATLAVEAGRQALEMARFDPRELDLIIVSTSSPEYIFPATACLVQDRLGASRAGAFDLSAACSGFIFALNIGAQMIRSGSLRSVLVIGAETLSRFVDWEDRNTCVLFGDGAGAFLLQALEEPGGVLAGMMRSDGSGEELLILPAGGSRRPASVQSVQERQHYIRMNGREVFRFATRAMAQITQETVASAGLTLDEINLIIPHQANARIIEAAARALKVPLERCYMNLERYGNTSTASVPMAACEAAREGRLKPGDRVVLVGFGAGLTWGASVLVWSGPRPGVRRISPLGFRLYARVRSLLKRWVRWVDARVWGHYSNGKEG